MDNYAMTMAAHMLLKDIEAHEEWLEQTGNAFPESLIDLKSAAEKYLDDMNYKHE